ncbi:MAG: FAD-binding oxidoreductase [Deltaproteobacteria bacterium]|nr:FAD-binding oxidoreductase [Deltaproteobacteria bacterium]
MGGARGYEVVIVGAGIAGASLAHFLAEGGLGDVLLLEREEQLAVHSTGRSAATLSQLDRVRTSMELIVASAPFFQSPPPGFAEHPLLDPIGVVSLFGEDAWSELAPRIPALNRFGLACHAMTPAEVLRRSPALDPTTFAAGLMVPGDGRLDVHEILSSYVRHARSRGVELRTSSPVEGFLIEAGRCRGVVVRGETIRARVVVNAGGAWAATLGAQAGASPIRLVPHRRTIVTFAPPDGVDASKWTFVSSDPHSVYFSPEAGDLLLSPMDEEAMEPCDATPDDEVIAAGLARFAHLAPSLAPRSIKRRWSGLRTFSPDRVHVVGEDPARRGFFWLAGQGGCGIETSPVIGRVAADLILRGETRHFDARRLDPARFA